MKDIVDQCEKTVIVLLQAAREMREIVTKYKDGTADLSVTWAARYLGLSAQTLRRKEESGELVPQRGENKYRYYTKKQLDEYLDGKGHKVAASATKETDDGVAETGRGVEGQEEDFTNE